MDPVNGQPPPPSPEAAGAARNWLDLPRDVAAAILRRLGVVDLLTSAQYVCTTWRGISRDPSMWRHVDMLIPEDPHVPLDYVSLCRLAVDLSQGGLVGVAISHFADDDLLLYISERGSQLKRLELVSCYNLSDKALATVASKVPLLEELEFSYCNALVETVEVFGRCCPLLKTFKLNRTGHITWYTDVWEDGEAQAIARNMPGLVKLQILGNRLTNVGLEAITDACPHLDSLDLRRCFNLDLRGELGKTCAGRIKDLRLPYYPTDDYPFNSELGYFNEDGYFDSDGLALVYDDHLEFSGPSDDDSYDDSTVEDLGYDDIFPWN